jgi:threonine/homoserine/homoserine lactone efflux protein
MLEISQILSYAVALGIAAAIPGPGITALVSRSVASGPVVAFAMLGGLIMGDLVYLSFAVFGLAFIAKNFSILFIAIRWFSILYLLWLAYSFWKAEQHDLSQSTFTKKDMASAALSGLTITLGNPKTIAFYLALLPLVLNLENVGITSWATALVPVTILVLLLVGGAFILAALGVRRLLSTETAQRRLHRSAAVAMAAAAGSMVLREF